MTLTRRIWHKAAIIGLISALWHNYKTRSQRTNIRDRVHTDLGATKIVNARHKQNSNP